MKRVFAYILREVHWTFIAVVTVLTFIAMSNKFASLLSKAAQGEIPTRAVFSLVAYYIPELFTLVAPLGLFLAILLALGRLYVDSEMAALRACGVGQISVLRATLPYAALVALVTAMLTLFLIPEINLSKERYLVAEEAEALIRTMSPGRFHTTDDGKLVFYAEGLSDNGRQMEHVFILEQPTQTLEMNNPWEVITAESGYVVRDETTGSKILQLNDGHRYDGIPGHADYFVVNFERYGRVLDLLPDEVPLLRRTTSSADLVRSDDLGDKAELQWRVGLPLAVLTLTILAVPLSRVAPRQGRFARILPAIVVFVVYMNLLSVTKRWVESESLPVWVGTWWVHLLFLATGLRLLLERPFKPFVKLARWHHAEA